MNDSLHHQSLLDNDQWWMSLFLDEVKPSRWKERIRSGFIGGINIARDEKYDKTHSPSSMDRTSLPKYEIEFECSSSANETSNFSIYAWSINCLFLTISLVANKSFIRAT